MATLYTSAPQREGLDWLAGMTRDAQQLWQNQARIEQSKRQLALQAQQQQMAEQHFWAEQARLKGQEDFQNRKFLYSMKQDQFANSMAEKRLGFEGRRVDNEETRLNAALDPNSPENRYRTAATGNLEASAEQTRAETADLYGGGVKPKVTTYWFGETGTDSDYKNAFGEGMNKGKVDKYSLALSPDQEKLVRSHGVIPGDKLEVKLSDGSIVERRWDDRTDGSLAGRWDFHGGDAPDPNDGKGVVGFKLKGAQLPFTPVGSGSAAVEEKTPEIEEHGGMNFIRYPRSKKQGGDYFQLAPIAKGQGTPEVTPEIIGKMKELGFEPYQGKVGGVTFRKPVDPKTVVPKLATVRNADGNIVSATYDPATDSYKVVQPGEPINSDPSKPKKTGYFGK